MADHRMVGKTGRVTGRVGPNRIGEVMVPVRGGTEAFHARPVDSTTEIAVGARIVVVEYHPPRMVFVAPL